MAALKGVGPQVLEAAQEAALTRVVDLLYHLPTGAIERVRAPAATTCCSDERDPRPKPFETREPLGRGPMRVFASDSDGNTISLIYFNNPAGPSTACRWARSTVSGKLEAYGRRVGRSSTRGERAGEGLQPALREPVYPLTEADNRRLENLRVPRSSAHLSFRRIEPSLRPRKLGRVALSLALAHREPGTEGARRRSPTTSLRQPARAAAAAPFAAAASHAAACRHAS